MDNWIGGAIVGAVLIVGDRILQWWTRIKDQHEKSEDFVIKKYQGLVKQLEDRLELVIKQIDIIELDHERTVTAHREAKEQLARYEERMKQSDRELVKLQECLDIAEARVVELENKLDALVRGG